MPERNGRTAFVMAPFLLRHGCIDKLQNKHECVVRSSYWEQLEDLKKKRI